MVASGSGRKYSAGMGDKQRKTLRPFLRVVVLMLLLSTAVSGCLAEPRQPDLSGREDFARSVMSAAVSDSVESVEALVDPVFSNTRPEAQQLVDSARGWTPGSWQLGISNDIPEVANVTASRNGHASAVRFAISWSNDRWVLVMGESTGGPSSGASVGAKPVGPGADPKILSEGAAPSTGASSQPTQPTQPAGPRAACPASTAGTGSGTGTDALTCRTFTSTSGYARGHNMHWLTSSPLHVSFDRMDGVTMVVRMPCGVLNVPVSVDNFGLVPDPARMAESADGCGGPDAEHRAWTSAFFKAPLVYQLNSAELVLTNELGQVRFKQN